MSRSWATWAGRRDLVGEAVAGGKAHFCPQCEKLRIMEGEVFGIPLSARVERPDFKRTPSAWRWWRREKRQGLWTELLPLLQDPITGDERCSRWRTCSTEDSLRILYWKREAQDNKLIRRVDFYTVTENVTEYVIRGEDSDHRPVMAWGGDQWPPFNSNGFERAVEDIQGLYMLFRLMRNWLLLRSKQSSEVKKKLCACNKVRGQLYKGKIAIWHNAQFTAVSRLGQICVELADSSIGQALRWCNDLPWISTECTRP